MDYMNSSAQELEREYQALKQKYEEVKSKGLSLNMARGKPGKEQLDISNGMLSVLDENTDFVGKDGMDVRNYGILDGITECKELFAKVLGVEPKNVMIGGSSSLTMMFDAITHMMLSPVEDGCKPWYDVKNRKFLCPAPGYDRHFGITGYYDFEMIPVPMTENGPYMDVVEELIKDESVKGIWCVPKYSNPDGIVYSMETIRRFANLKPAAPDFIIMWDNAYCVHEFDGDFVPFPDILSLCRDAGSPDMVFEYASTSKITFPGAGISVMAASEANQKYMQKLMGVQMISYDKVNQLRHVRYLKDRAGTLALMKKHAAILKPKFDMVLETLEREIAPCGIAEWQKPKGGYFVSVNTMEGIATRTLALCKEAGVVMTAAGATFPYGKDPRDSNIRIAPSLPPVEELEQAMEVFCVSLKLAALEKLLG